MKPYLIIIIVATLLWGTWSVAKTLEPVAKPTVKQQNEYLFNEYIKDTYKLGKSCGGRRSIPHLSDKISVVCI
jgi:hypothetical protein